MRKPDKFIKRIGAKCTDPRLLIHASPRRSELPGVGISFFVLPGIVHIQRWLLRSLYGLARWTNGPCLCLGAFKYLRNHIFLIFVSERSKMMEALGETIKWVFGQYPPTTSKLKYTRSWKEISVPETRGLLHERPDLHFHYADHSPCIVSYHSLLDFQQAYRQLKVGNQLEQ
jgi:hypothetical protein